MCVRGCLCTRGDQKVLGLTKKALQEKMILVLFLNILSPDSNTLSSPTLKHSIPFLAEGCILSVQLCFNSMDDIIVAPKMATTKLRI
jgi:hypothetical protein